MIYIVEYLPLGVCDAGVWHYVTARKKEALKQATRFLELDREIPDAPLRRVEYIPHGSRVNYDLQEVIVVRQACFFYDGA